MRLKILKRKKWVVLSLCGVLILSVTAGMILWPKTEVDEDIIWREYPVERGNIIASLDGSGKLGFVKKDYSFSVDLKIKEVFVKVGQEVKKGDKLVDYSKEDIESKVAESKTALETAERALQDIKNSQQSEKLQNELTNTQSKQQAQNAYESSKRESENTIQELEQKEIELQEKMDSLKSELEEVSKAKGDDTEQTDTQQTETEQEQTEKISDNENQIADLNSQISTAQSELETTRQQLETQYSTLTNLKADYEKQYNQSQQNQGIQNQIDSLNNAGKENAVKNAQAEVDKAKKSLLEAQLLLDTPALTAESDGIVTTINNLPGEEVPANKAIVVIVDSQKKQVTISVSQEDISSVEVGQSVELRFSASPENVVDGKVIKKNILPVEDGDGSSYEVTISLDKDDPELLEGMTCSVKFILKKVENVLTLANKAITLRDGKQYVTVKLSDGSHEEREIKTGFSDGRITEIIDGLSDGDIAVVAG